MIDDEKVIRQGCRRTLDEEGYEVTTASTGSEGLRLIESRSYSLVLLDLMMPGMEGLEALARIRRTDPGALVVIITGYATVGKAVETMRRGAVDFLAKPFLPDQLRETVRRALAARGGPAAPPPGGAGPSEPDGAAAGDRRTVSILNCLEVGVAVTDCDGALTSLNPRALECLDRGRGDLKGRRVEECLPEKSLVLAVERALTDGASSVLELAPGSLCERFLKVRCSPLGSRDDGGIRGSVIVLDDISTAKKMEAVKSEFVGTVVHELRAPLATVQQLVYFLKEEEAGPVNKTQAQLLGRVLVRLGELLDLVKNLLNIAKMEAGTLMFQMAPVDPGVLVEGCVEDFLPLAEARNIDLKSSLDEGVPQVMADVGNLKIAINNLISNAIKYSGEGGEVAVGLQVQEDRLVITVRDTGMGIPEKDLPKIFDKFYRVADERTRWITGSGLGLSLTKSIVEKHNGRIEVESEPGKGATFRVFLPALY